MSGNLVLDDARAIRADNSFTLVHSGHDDSDLHSPFIKKMKPKTSYKRRMFVNLGVSEPFHFVIRQIAALERKKIFEVCDDLLPIVEKRLAKLQKPKKL